MSKGVADALQLSRGRSERSAGSDIRAARLEEGEPSVRGFPFDFRVASRMKGRPPAAERTFHSQLVEDKLATLLPTIRDEQLAASFAQCWLNTLDTTVHAHDGDLREKDHAKARPTTWIITGMPR